MSSSGVPEVHVVVGNTMADWEIGHAVAHLPAGPSEDEKKAYRVRYASTTLEPVTTQGGMRILPDMMLDAVNPARSSMLILPGGNLWFTDEYVPVVDKAEQFLDSGIPVAAICGATGALAARGLLDARRHTSNSLEFLESLGYGGSDFYTPGPATTNEGLITASGLAPVEFAREILETLEVYPPTVLQQWYHLFSHA